MVTHLAKIQLIFHEALYYLHYIYSNLVKNIKKQNHMIQQQQQKRKKCIGYRYEPGHEKMCLMSYSNNKGADQPAHPRSLICAFVVRCLYSIISLDSMAEISKLQLASVAAQAGLCLGWSETPEDTFSHGVAHMYIHCHTRFDINTRELYI